MITPRSMGVINGLSSSCLNPEYTLKTFSVCLLISSTPQAHALKQLHPFCWQLPHLHSTPHHACRMPNASLLQQKMTDEGAHFHPNSSTTPVASLPAAAPSQRHQVARPAGL